MDLEQHVSVLKAYLEPEIGMKRFAGIGRDSVGETVQAARAAIRYGADALVLVAPYYMPLRGEGIVRYYDKLLGMLDADVIAYNIPQLTGTNITLGMFERIRGRHRNLIGIKDSGRDFSGFGRFCLGLPDDVIVLQGNDDLLLQSMMLGASGGVSGTTNFDPTAIKVARAYSKKDMQTAKRLQGRLDSIMDAVMSVEFPLAIHYEFYRKVMHRETINAIEPFYRNDRSLMAKARKAMAQFE